MGTTYASNLRLLVQNMTADQLMAHAPAPAYLPPGQKPKGPFILFPAE